MLSSLAFTLKDESFINKYRLCCAKVPSLGVPFQSVVKHNSKGLFKVFSPQPGWKVRWDDRCLLKSKMSLFFTVLIQPKATLYYQVVRLPLSSLRVPVAPRNVHHETESRGEQPNSSRDLILKQVSDKLAK